MLEIRPRSKTSSYFLAKSPWTMGENIRVVFERLLSECERWGLTDRRRAFAAALPLLLFGLVVAAITFFLLTIGGPSQIVNLARAPLWHNLALVVGAITLVALILVAVVAILRRLPVWSYTWIGAGLTGLLIVLNLVTEDRGFIISPVVDITVLVLFLLSALVTFGTAASRGWQHTGLFSIGVCATLGSSVCFFGVAGPAQFSLGLLAALLGGAEALLVYAYVRRSNAVQIAALISVGAANVGVSWIVEWVFRSSNPSRDISQFWYLVVLLTALLFGGTLVGLPGQFMRRVLSRKRDR